MKSLICFVSILGLSSGCGGHTESSEPLPVTAAGTTDDARFRSVLSAMEADMQAHHVPGGAIAIVENGTLVASAGVGEKREGTDGPVLPSTRFRVASLTKMVTAATALSLVEEGKIGLTNPITDYVPLSLAAGSDPHTVLVQHLLSHTSGIPDMDVGQNCDITPGARDAYFAGHGDQPLWTPPGQVWNYSNQGFAVAGWAVEKASGQSYESAVEQRVFAKAGMTTATFDPALATAGDHATGHHHVSGQPTTFLEPDAYDCAATRPADGVIASVLDYAHFTEALLAGGGTMLSPSSTKDLTSSHADTDRHPAMAEGYGDGLFVRNGYKGFQVLRHTGSDPGYRSSIWMVPSQGLAVVVFYNVENHSPDTLVSHAIDTYLGTTDVTVPSETTPASSWTTYEGNYVDPFALGPIGVYNDGGTLHLTAPSLGAADLTLKQNAGDAFDVVDDESGALVDDSDAVTFYPGPNGPATYLVTRRGVARRSP